MHDVSDPRLTRRRLIQGFAAAGAATWLAPEALAKGGRHHHDFARFTAIAPAVTDELQVPDGYETDLLIAWGDELGDGMTFGYNADFTAYFPLRGDREGILWVNHEYAIPYYNTDWRSSRDATWDPRVEPFKTLMAIEKDAVGGSLVHVRRHPGHGAWRAINGSRFNRRISAAGPLSARSGETAFTWQNVLEGGQHTGFASPDNLAFSRGDQLWLATDISTSSLNVPGRGFEWHGNNALYHVPLAGPTAHQAFRFANAPIRAELTGPTLVPRARTMFLSVQHPGEPNTADLDKPTEPAAYTSWWPDGNVSTGANPSKPKPAVVAIRKTRGRW